jgi:hypothetical protein
MIFNVSEAERYTTILLLRISSVNLGNTDVAVENGFS